MTSTERVNILLVDDQPAKLMTLEAILMDLGETLLKASSAPEALDCLLRNEIAVVLVDVCMPDLDGYELASMIRQHPRFGKTAIIFVSAILMTDLDRLRGYESGGVDYVPVPVVPEILRAKVRVFAELYRKTRQLESLNQELEERVTERTAALEATTAALLDLNRRKDEFLAMLAHELRNPLAPIRTAVQLMGLSNAPEAQRERSRQIVERQVEHLVRLVDDLVDVSRISRDIVTLRRAEVDLSEVVARAIEITRPVVDARGLSLTIDMPAETLTVHGEAPRLTQVLGNVLSNAAKFTERGGSIRLTVERENAEVVIRVRDTGIGVPPDMLSKIFDLFVQVDYGNRETHGGLGVGLALVRRLVELHGGTVQALSDGPGLGTEVVIRLPLYAPLSAGSALPAASSSSLKPVGRRVLIVDDNRDAAEALALLLQLEGHDVRIAYDGFEALEVGAAFEADVVLLDLGMPNLNGWDAARRMREQVWGRQASIIAVTGWGQPLDRQRTAEAGFDLHLVKPVAYSDLSRALMRLPRASDRSVISDERA